VNSLSGAVGERLRPWLLTGTAGTGAMLAYFFVQALRSDPELMKEVIVGVLRWGPLFVICAALIWVLDNRMKEFAAANRDSATQQQRMADAMQQLAQKDDIERRELKLTIGYVASQQEKILERLDEVLTSGRSKGAHA